MRRSSSSSRNTWMIGSRRRIVRDALDQTRTLLSPAESTRIGQSFETLVWIVQSEYDFKLTTVKTNDF